MVSLITRAQFVGEHLKLFSMIFKCSVLSGARFPNRVPAWKTVVSLSNLCLNSASVYADAAFFPEGRAASERDGRVPGAPEKPTNWKNGDFLKRQI